MRAIRTVVVAVVLCAMFSPAAPALAKSEPQTPPIAAQVLQSASTLARTASTLAATSEERSEYAKREQQAPAAQNFKGGFVYIYFGSGLALALVIILLLLIV